MLRDQAERVGFEDFTFERDACDDIQVSVPGLDTPKIRVEFAAEAQSVGFEVSFEPPDILKRPRLEYVKAVFGVLPTLKRADALRFRMAHNGFREGADIERLALHRWRVVVHGIPSGESIKAEWAAQARRVGYQITYIR